MGNERRKHLLELLSMKAEVTLSEMQEMYPHISSMTLRRDIDYFVKNGYAVKIRGGMKSIPILTESADKPFTTRMQTVIDRKKMIAKSAASMMCPGDTVFIDSGSTATSFASVIPNEHFNIVTSSLTVADEVSKKDLPIINMIGGLMVKNSRAFISLNVQKDLDGIATDIAFIVPSGISMDGVVTCGNFAENRQKLVILENAKKKVMLIDSTKFGRTFPYVLGKAGMFDVIITDRPLPAPLDMIADKAGIQVILA